MVLAALLAAPGCQADKGAVQVGPVDGPAAEAVAFMPVEADVASPEANVSVARSRTTSQPAETHVDADAGRDARQITVNLTASGGGWAAVATLLATAAVIVAVVLAVMYVRARSAENAARGRVVTAVHNIDRARAEYERLYANAVAVADAISKQPAGVERNALLATIRAMLPNKLAWDDVLEQHGLRVHKTAPPKRKRRRKVAV